MLPTIILSMLIIHITQYYPHGALQVTITDNFCTVKYQISTIIA
jgi:hypothetical protein